MLNDLHILKRIKEGDVKAFESIFRLHYAPLCFYATGITGNKEEAEEIVQELFYIFWKERERLQLFYSIKSYLYGAVYKQSLKYLEHKEVVNHYCQTVLANADRDNESAKPSDAQESLEYEELSQLIGWTLNKLPERRRKIFLMQRKKGMKYSEIAQELCISVKTVEAEMSHALKTLKKVIERYNQQ